MPNDPHMITVAGHNGVILELIVGCDYEFTWMIDGLQRRLRISRMNFQGLGGPSGEELVWNGRGPNRETDGEFCGTAYMPPRQIRSVKEFPAIPAERYAQRKA